MTDQGFQEEEALGKAYDARLMKRLMGYVRPYQKLLIISVGLLLLVSLSQIVQARLIQTGIDKHITPGISNGFLSIILIYIGVITITFLATFAQVYITQYLGQRVQFTMRMQVFRHLQKLHLGFFDRNPVGRLVTRVTNDVNVLDDLFSSGVVEIFGDLFMLIFIISYMLYINWQLALITFVVVPLIVLATFLFRARARDAYREVRLRLARLNAFLQEHITGVTIVQLFTQEKRISGKFEQANRDLRNVHLRSIYYYAVFFPTVELIGAVSTGLVLYYGGVRIIGGQLTLGELVAFLYLVERFFRPIRDLAEQYNILQSSMASSERIFRLLDTKPQIVDVPVTKHISEFQGRIDVENLWFAYDDEDWVLKDVSFSVEPGQKIAIVGATGAGKSSLISLLFRFYDYQKGSIKLDGVEIRDLPVSELRACLGLVLQDVFLFSGDLIGNVRLRDLRISEEQVRQALTRVGYDRFLEHMPDGLQSVIHERGATLSTGQKQLLSFARALAFDPAILILDEATSSVDTETERLIQGALDELLKGRTAIVIAHRLSTIEKADQIMVFHHGRLREKGRHDELLKQKGIYYRLYEVQFKKELAGQDGLSKAAK